MRLAMSFLEFRIYGGPFRSPRQAPVTALITKVELGPLSGRQLITGQRLHA